MLWKSEYADGDKKSQEILNWLCLHRIHDEFHSFIKRPDAYRRLFSGINGWHWENEFAELATEQGLPCTCPVPQGLQYDAVVNDYKIQCKATCKTGRVDIRCKGIALSRRYSVTDFNILALKVVDGGNPTFYFIPAELLIDEENSGVLKSSISLSEYASYVNNWDIFK